MENRRKHQRFRAAVAAEIELDGELYEGKTRDLSETGASVLIQAPLLDGAAIQLTLFLTEDGIEAPDAEPFVLEAEVMWIAPQPQKLVLAGLRFATPSAQDALRLAQLLAVVTTTGG
jgi:PilZ domain